MYMGTETQIGPSQGQSIGIEIFLSTEKVDGLKQKVKRREMQ
jgi:hypothetical protein